MKRTKMFIIKACIVLAGYFLIEQTILTVKLMLSNKEWIVSRTSAIKRYYESKNNKFGNKNNRCPLPNLNPFDGSILKYMKTERESCNMKKYGSIENNMYTLSASEEITHVYLQYVRRGSAVHYKEIVSNEKNNLDDLITLSDKITLHQEGDFYKHILTEDFIRVTIVFGTSVHVEHHASLSKTKTLSEVRPLKDIDNGMPYNVVLYMIDSLSYANFKRQLIQTDDLMSNDDDTIIFKGQTIVGDGTTAALSALLTGIPEHLLPETRRSFSNQTCDIYKLIFKDFKERGYATYFSEDDTQCATFNYRLNGFIKPPTTCYIRPYFLSLAKENNFIQDNGVCGTEESIQLLKTFFNEFRSSSKFAVAITSLVSHNTITRVQVIDEHIKDLYSYFKNELVNENSIFVLFGDHGFRYGSIRKTLQGKLEERLPFLSITLPKSFKEKYKEAYKNLQDNSNILTTPFDIYETLKHLLTYPTLPKPKSFGQSLFTPINGRNRTCSNAGVEEHWCPCFSEITVNPSSKEARDIANELINEMNNLITINEDTKTKCAQISLHKIDSISKRMVNNEVNHFVESKRDEKCDSCGVISSNRDSTNSFIFYEVSFTVLPSKGTFEASGRFQNRKPLDKPVYSRTNMYGNQPSCISSKYPQLRPYCYCK